MHAQAEAAGRFLVILSYRQITQISQTGNEHRISNRYNRRNLWISIPTWQWQSVKSVRRD